MSTKQVEPKKAQIMLDAFEVHTWIKNPNGSADVSFKPNSIERVHDGEIFTIGDEVTNGTHMKGKITGFEFLEGKVFVKHTWSGVGMNLGSLTKMLDNTTPSKYQYGDNVKFLGVDAVVIAVHFYPKTKYDLELSYDHAPCRVYNVEERCITE